MLATDYPFLDLMWTMVIFFMWILWFWLLFTVFADIFRRHDLSGLGKTGWLIFAILLPFLGVFIYLITQNVGMTERNLERSRAQRDQFDQYVQQTAGSGGGARPRSTRPSSSSTPARSRRPSSRRSSRRRSPEAIRRGRHDMAVETTVLTGLEPRSFWAHFEALTRIPRPSRHEEPVIEHVRAWAAEHGFELHQDAGRNLVIRVPATPGRESAPVVSLQGHLDMVCEREPSSPNDPAEGRIALVRDGDWLKADGTTLGADDGVAIAAMMALAEDASLPHGPLELLMTVAEEVGLEGANAFDGSLVEGRILVNLDSEEDGKLTVGCAGSTDTWVRVDAPRDAPVADAVALAVTVSGGLGGHSGMNIEFGRSNAIKVLGRALREAHAAVPFRLVSLDGGKSRNAIPRDAAAVVSVDGGDGRRISGRRSRPRPRRSATRSRRPIPGVDGDRGRGASRRRRVDGGGDDDAARRDRARADRAPRDEPGLRRARRDVAPRSARR